MTKRNTAFTLVELMTALAISLILLLGVIELFRSVGGTIQETQATLNMSSNLNAAATQLRSDLGKINPKLVHQPHEMVTNNTSYDEQDGYFEIIEGMNAPPQYINSNGGTHILTEKIALNSEMSTADLTVGDVDDVLAFTARSSEEYPFRGLINGTMKDSTNAEIVYFVRGNTLYRRVLLIADEKTPPSFTSYERDDISAHREGSGMKPNTLSDLKDRRNRFGHYNNDASNGQFPFPIYNNSDIAWYYLRLPLLEETIHTAWNVGQTLPTTTISLPNTFTVPTTPTLDFWSSVGSIPTDLAAALDTKSGAIKDYVSTPRELRAGEDIILKNVLSFDVKVWNPYWVPCNGAYAQPQYVDLGQDKFNSGGTVYDVNYSLLDVNGGSIPYSGSVSSAGPPPDGTPPKGAPIGFGFTTKGHYGGIIAAGGGQFVTTVDYTVPSLITGANVNVPMPCVFDSWTKEYEKAPYDAIYNPLGVRRGAMETNVTGTPPSTPRTGTGISNPANSGSPETNANNWECPPPYEMDLTSIQITIRCFDPESKNIRQVRIVHHFPR